jgi:predicted TIM-barrel fold metal-dependent hydrolase
MGVSVEQCVLGTDYPYGIPFWSVDDNIAGLTGAAIEEGEKEGVYWGNARRLWGRGV